MTAASLLPVWQAAAAGFLGGMAPDALRLLAARHDGLPGYLRTRFFWASLVFLAALGAGVAALSHPTTLQAALALGYSAPSIVSALGAKAGGEPKAEFRAARRTSLLDEVRRWWVR